MSDANSSVEGFGVGNTTSLNGIVVAVAAEESGLISVIDSVDCLTDDLCDGECGAGLRGDDEAELECECECECECPPSSEVMACAKPGGGFACNDISNANSESASISDTGLERHSTVTCLDDV